MTISSENSHKIVKNKFEYINIETYKTVCDMHYSQLIAKDTIWISLYENKKLFLIKTEKILYILEIFLIQVTGAINKIFTLNIFY